MNGEGVGRIAFGIILFLISIFAGGSAARAAAYCAVEAPMVTGSKRPIADATAANARCAGCARRRQLSGRSGQSIQQHWCGPSSDGIAKPSRAGVVVRLRGMSGL